MLNKMFEVSVAVHTHTHTHTHTQLVSKNILNI